MDLNFVIIEECLFIRVQELTRFKMASSRLRDDTLLGGGALLLLGHHNLVAIEVSKGSALLLVGELLGPRGGIPLCLHAFISPCLDKLLLAAVLADLDNDVSESKALKKHDLPVDAGSALRTINQHLSM